MKKQINLVLRRNVKSVLLTLAVLATLVLASCKRDIINKPEQSKTLATATNSINSSQRLGLSYQEGDVVLGAQLKNPYTLQNITKSYDSLISKGVTSIYPVNIRETHYYVKFKPKSWDEYDDLKEDTTLELSDIPYDYEIIQNGNYYHDPSITDSLPTYQYASVPAGFDFNDTIAYEIISPLYIPEEDNSLIGNNDENELYVDKLLNQAYKLTENFEDTIPIESSSALKYTPGGNIQIFDTRLSANYGMESVKVTARRWFIVYVAHTDFFGNYRMKHKFKRPSNYAVWFEYKRFFVKGKGSVHWINGPKQTGDWNHVIANGYDRFVGHIFRGAYRYHYKDIDGLQRPFRWLGRKTSYIAKDANKSWAGTNPIIFNNIKIARWKNGEEEYMSDEVFSTTCHETGHTSHAIRMNTVFQYWQVSRQLQESWAIALEWVITHREYADRSIANYGEFAYFPPNPPDYPNSYAYQYWNGEISGRYTPLYIDIIDNHNEIGVQYFGLGTGSVNDQVGGYSLAFIETEMLKHIYGLASLSDQLKAHKPAGVTDAQIDLLISHY